MRVSYKNLKYIAVFFGVITFFWVVFDTVKNYEKPDQLYQKANNDFLKKNYESSYKLYKELYKKNNENLFALEGMARSLTRLRKYTEAESIFLSVIKKDKDFTVAYANLGILYDTIGKHEKALFYYKIAIKNDKEIIKGMSWFKRFLKNIQFKPSSISERSIYLEKQLNNNKRNNLKYEKVDRLQPDFQM